jgi:hypothetical protein
MSNFELRDLFPTDETLNRFRDSCIKIALAPKRNSRRLSKTVARRLRCGVEVRPRAVRLLAEREELVMAKRITERQRLAFKLDSLTDTEVKEVLDYISIMESMRRTTSAIPAAWDDDLISLLAEAQENQRAQQAFEWESVRRRAERRAGVVPRV